MNYMEEPPFSLNFLSGRFFLKGFFFCHSITPLHFSLILFLNKVVISYISINLVFNWFFCDFIVDLLWLVIIIVLLRRLVMLSWYHVSFFFIFSRHLFLWQI